MKKILIFGNGQIANFYKNTFPKKGYEVQIASADITDISQVKSAIETYNPDIVINTAAKTSLEWCESNKLDAFNVNVLGAGNVAQICDEKGIYFIHFSSGCIFASKDENDAKSEDSIPHAVSYYSWTKVWGENMVKYRRSKDFKYVILRPRQPVSSQVSRMNMLVKMLTFTRFIDVPNTGTVIEDLMDWTDLVIQKQFIGELHVANDGWTTPYQMGLLIKKYILPDLEPIKITKEELNKLTPVQRVDTVMDVSRLKSLGANVKPYYERLEEIIKQLGENIKNCDKEVLKTELEATAARSKERTIVNDVWPCSFN